MGEGGEVEREGGVFSMPVHLRGESIVHKDFFLSDGFGWMGLVHGVLHLYCSFFYLSSHPPSPALLRKPHQPPSVPNTISGGTLECHLSPEKGE